MNALNRILLTSSILLAGVAHGRAQPFITRQPTNQSVSLGANVSFQVSATSTNGPILVQWRMATTNVPMATNSSLNLTNIQIINSGDYDAVLTNGSGSVTSIVAHLDVDATFTKISGGSIVNDGGYGFGCAWGDYDGDGFPDLFVCNWGDGEATPHDFLYHNRGDGTFNRITTTPVGNANHYGMGAAWGDYDNDGKLDLFVTSITGDSSGLGYNALYHNDGSGHFTRVTTGALVTQRLRSHSGIWADFDNDGWLDVFVANFTIGVGSTIPALDNLLYHNNGNGTFGATSFGAKALSNGDSLDVAAADFNNDGWLDLFVPQGGVRNPQNGLLYSNNLDGTFTLRTGSAAYTNKAYSIACAWGDYDNDGFLDLFVTRIYDGRNSLYHNNGDGTFILVTNAAPALDGGNSTGCAWADYDNDGWLDLFVANVGPFDPNTLVSTAPGTNFLYHNNGDGSFSKITTGSLANDVGYSIGAAWADYDNDGFLDLFVSNGWITKSENNYLYHNNRNTNNWINFRLVGTASNRSAIGAKVRVKASIGGRTLWQMREISGGSGHGCQNDLRASFGLGDATNVDLVRIEWPSGIAQTITNVAATQFLTVVEHQSSEVVRPFSFNSISRFPDGTVNLGVSGSSGARYVFEGSTNLVNWSWLGARTNLTGTIEFIDKQAPSFSKRFYRVSVP